MTIVQWLLLPAFIHVGWVMLLLVRMGRVRMAAVRKGAHVVEYAVLAVLARRAWALTDAVRGWGLTAARLAWLALGLAVACAALDEYRQSFTRSRQGSVWDVLLDAAGAALGLLCWKLFLLWRERRRQRLPVARDE